MPPFVRSLTSPWSLLASRRSCAIIVAKIAVAVALLCVAASAFAQVKPMTVLSFDGLTATGSTTREECVSDDECDIIVVHYYNLNFTVKNTSTASQYLSARQSCYPYCRSVIPQSVTGPLNPGQTATIIVALQFSSDVVGSISAGVSVAAATATGYHYDSATQAIVPNGYQEIAPYDSYSATVTVTNGVATTPPTLASYRPSVTPKASTESVPFATTLTRSFTIQNPGTQTTTYAISSACGTIVGCGPTKTTTTLGAGASDVVNVTFTTPGTTSATGIVKLIATYTSASGQTIADTGSRPIATPALRPSVGPKGTVVVVAGNTIGAATFSVRNNGNLADSYIFTPVCAAWATSCTIDDPTIDEDGTAWLVTVHFRAINALGGPTYPTAAVRLAAHLGTAADTGWVAASLGYSTPVFAPQTRSVTDPAQTTRTVSATLTNTGNLATGYYITSACAGVSNCLLFQQSVYLNPGASSTVAGQYTAPASGQSGTVRFMAAHALGPGFVEADTTLMTTTGGDVLSPTIALTGAAAPNEGAIVTAGRLNVVVSACDPDGTLTNPTVSLNGSALSVAFTASSSPTCRTIKTGSLETVARAGTNTLTIAAADGHHTTTLSRHFTYDESYEATPVVTALAATRLLRGGQQSSDTFAIRNPGPLTVTYALSAGCSGGALACAIPSSVVVPPAQTARVGVAYTTSTTGLSATVWPIVRYTGSTGRVVTVSNAPTAIALDQAAPTATITGTTSGATIEHLPSVSVAWCDADGVLASHTVTVDGVALSANYTSRTQSGCKSAGTSAWTNVPVALGSHTIRATATDAAGHLTATTLPFTFALPPIADFQPDVVPRLTLVYLMPAEQTVTWAVRNIGTRAARYHITVDCSTIPTSGCQVDRSDIMIAAGATDSARATFALRSLPTSPKDIRLIASYADAAGRVTADTGVVSGLIPTLAQLYQPQIQQPIGTLTVPPGLITAIPFYVTNVGTTRVTYHMDVTATAPYELRSWLARDTLTVSAGQTATYQVQPVSPLSLGIHGTLTVRASYTSGGQSVFAESAADLMTVAAAPLVAMTAPGGTTLSIAAASAMAIEISNTGTVSFAGSARAACTGMVFNCRFAPRQGVQNDQPDLTQVATNRGSTTNLAVQFDVRPSVVGAPDTGSVTVNLDGTAGTPSGTVHQVTQIGISRNLNAIAVAVSPHDLMLSAVAVQPVHYPFVITNLGQIPSAYDYTVHCASARGPGAPSSVTCPDTHGRTAVLGRGAAESVVANFSTTAIDSAGVVTLAATSVTDPSAHDVGTIATRLLSHTLIVNARGVNREAAVERGRCLTISAGENAAYECGDLRIAHSLPATTTMNTTRAPVLLYNSAHALGRAVVGADVTIPAGIYPESIAVTLKVRDATGANKVNVQRSLVWKREWSDGRPRRVTISFDASSVTLIEPGKFAGAFAYTLEVRSKTFAADVGQDVGTVVVIDRSGSPFGRGWWLEGLEQLIIDPADTMRVWVGGDGSARVYKKTQTAGVWTVSPTLDRPDTLLQVGGNYRRMLTNGAYVEFDRSGHHIFTKNRQGFVTTFDWDILNNRLRTIALPVPAGSPSRIYIFGYDATSHRLSSIDAPSSTQPRRVTLRAVASAGSWSVDRITDPDAKFVGFGLDASGRIRSRTNRRSFTTNFDFDEGGALRLSTLRMAGTGDDIVHTFCAAETSSLTSCADGARVSTAVRTFYDGPRLPSDASDTAAFFLNRFGAPVKIVDAFGDSTTLEHFDVAWPMLATAVIQPNRHRIEASYHQSRAVLVTTTDRNPLGDGRDAITRYYWSSASPFNVVDSIVGPTNDVARFGYFANGDRQWQQDGRGDSTRVTFGYSGRQLTTSTLPTGAATRFHYDRLGNLDSTITPIGFRNYVIRDAVGRDSVRLTPTDSAQTTSLRTRIETTYDAMDEVRHTVTIGAPTTYSPAGATPQPVRGLTLFVDQEYDDAGNLTSVVRRDAEDLNLGTGWTFDGANRRITENNSGVAHTYRYDPAGNITTHMTPRAASIEQTYDALNRLLARTIPGQSYAQQRCHPGVFDPFDCLNLARPFPYFGTSIVIPTDTEVFRYDNQGNLTRADNHDARIRRTYYPNGQLESDTLQIRQYDDYGQSGDVVFSAASSNLSYGYDLAGRRTTLTFNSFAGCSQCVQRYSYVPGTNALETITSPAQHSFRYRYDALGQPYRFESPGNVTTWTYDRDGRVLTRVQSASGLGHDERFSYDARGKVVGVAAGRSGVLPVQIKNAYEGLGALVMTEAGMLGNGGTLEEWMVDAVGNALGYTRDRGPYLTAVQQTNAIDNGSGQLMSTEQAIPTAHRDGQRQTTTEQEHDVSGNVRWTASETEVLHNGVQVEEDRDVYTMSWYGGDEKLRAYQTVGVDTIPGLLSAFEEYRYDALGRRVLMWSRRLPNCRVGGCISVMDRYVWDGDQLLAENRQRTGTDGFVYNPGQYTGNVVYVHGVGMDAPLALYKDGVFLQPQRNWRGHYDGGTNLAGTSVTDGVNWPGATLTAYLDNRSPSAQIDGWRGSLIQGMRDPSGLIYMRNRYYDPTTGRFTQQDPIGLAGGMNLYGFAGGDPVNFSDPFGLCPPKDQNIDDCPAESSRGLWDRLWNGPRYVERDGQRYRILAGVVPDVTPGSGAARTAFRSFTAFKRAMGGASEGLQWHHIVEQASNAERFGSDMVHDVENLIQVPTAVHQRISAYYSTKQAFTGGQTVRMWLRDQSFHSQLEFGMNTLRDFGIIR